MDLNFGSVSRAAAFFRFPAKEEGENPQESAAGGLGGKPHVFTRCASMHRTACPRKGKGAV